MATADADIRLLVLRIVESLVDDPRSVQMHSEDLGGYTCFRLRVGRSDIGKLIGKHGRTARSIRTVLVAASMKAGRRYELDILQADE